MMRMIGTITVVMMVSTVIALFPAVIVAGAYYAFTGHSGIAAVLMFAVYVFLMIWICFVIVGCAQAEALRNTRQSAFGEGTTTFTVIKGDKK